MTRKAKGPRITHGHNAVHRHRPYTPKPALEPSPLDSLKNHGCLICFIDSSGPHVKTYRLEAQVPPRSPPMFLQELLGELLHLLDLLILLLEQKAPYPHAGLKGLVELSIGFS